MNFNWKLKNNKVIKMGTKKIFELKMNNYVLRTKKI